MEHWQTNELKTKMFQYEWWMYWSTRTSINKQIELKSDNFQHEWWKYWSIGN